MALWPFYGATILLGACLSVGLTLTLLILTKLGRLDVLGDAVQHKVDALMLRHVGKMLRRRDYAPPMFLGEHSATQASNALIQAFNIRARVEPTTGAWQDNEQRPLFTVVWPDQEEDVSGAQHYLCGFEAGYRYAAVAALDPGCRRGRNGTPPTNRNGILAEAPRAPSSSEEIVEAPSVATFLAQTYRLHALAETDRALDGIFDWVAARMREGEPGTVRCDAMLRAVNVTLLNEDLLVGFLTATYAASQLLPGRLELAERVREYLSGEIGADEAGALVNMLCM